MKEYVYASKEMINVDYVKVFTTGKCLVIYDTCFDTPYELLAYLKLPMGDTHQSNVAEVCKAIIKMIPSLVDIKTKQDYRIMWELIKEEVHEWELGVAGDPDVLRFGHDDYVLMLCDKYGVGPDDPSVDDYPEEIM